MGGLTSGNPVKADEEEEEEVSFEELGLEPRLLRALSKKGITKSTPIQREAIPLILEGKDVVARRAKTGSGKTFAYLLPMLQKLLSESGSLKAAPPVFILVPTRELCQQGDLLLSYGYEDDLKALIPQVPRRCQCLLMSATTRNSMQDYLIT